MKSCVHSLVLVAGAVGLLASCDADQATRTLTVFAAASMGPTLDAVKPVFERQNPGVRLEVELSGSRLACAKVADQKRDADLVVVADYELIDQTLIPEHAQFNVLFGNNALVLAYSAMGPHAAALRAGTPWQEVLARPEVSVGIASPRQAPVGYRALLALQLNDLTAAEPLKQGQAIAAKIAPAHHRPDVAKLVAPLQAGELDAAFVYLSEARQHGLEYIALDPRIDFSRLEHEAFYRAAKLTLPAEGALAPLEVHGAAAVYGLTIPTSAPHKGLAAKLVTALLSDAGRAAAKLAHMDLYTPAEVSVRGKPPAELGELARH
jgi:molybdate/tungstate transport system substrate-binding protein